MSAGAQKLRLFVALPLPAKVKEGLSATQNELRRLLPPRAASWTRPENLHLTLRFLGDVAPERLDALTASLRKAAAGFGALALRAERLGAFPNERRPRVIWAGVEDNASQLAELQKRVNAATHDFSRHPLEDRFIGHVTLARIRQIQRPESDALATFLRRAFNRGFGSWTATHIDLMRSELLPDGSRYTGLASIAL